MIVDNCNIVVSGILDAKIAVLPRNQVNIGDISFIWNYLGNNDLDRSAHLLLDYVSGYKKVTQTPHNFDSSAWVEFATENLENEPDRPTEAEVERVPEDEATKEEGADEVVEIKDPTITVDAEASTSGRET